MAERRKGVGAIVISVYLPSARVNTYSHRRCIFSDTILPSLFHSYHLLAPLCLLPREELPRSFLLELKEKYGD